MSRTWDINKCVKTNSLIIVNVVNMFKLPLEIFLLIVDTYGIIQILWILSC